MGSRIRRESMTLLFGLSLTALLMAVPTSVIASSMTYCCSNTISVTVNSLSSATGNIWSSNNGPSNHFWTVSAYIGTSGGINTQPALFTFTPQDWTQSSGGTVTTSYAQCGDAKNNWIQTSKLVWSCTLAGYVGGYMNVAYLVYNADNTYSRIYQIEGVGYYE